MILRKLIAVSAVLALTAACGKKGSDSDSDSDEEAQPEGVLQAYAEVAASAGKINLTAYDSGTELALTSVETWVDADFGTTPRFNCFGECSGSVTAKQYVADALDEEKSGPLGTAIDSISTLCMVGVFYADHLDADGLPKVGDIEFTVDEDIKEAMINECDSEEGDIANITDATLSSSVTAVEGDDYDRYIVFKMETSDGEEEYPFYFKNSGGKVAIASFEKEGTATDGEVTQSIFSLDLADRIFRMEYYHRTWPTNGSTIAEGGSFSYYRGYYEENTGEIRFFSNMGNSAYQLNNTFLSVSANESEDEAGAYFSRTTNENTSLTGAFACFNKEDGSFVNSSGCVENSSDDRNIAWSSSEELWIAVEAKDFADFSADPVGVPEFDAETMFSVEPNF